MKMKWGYEISSKDKEHIKEDLFTNKAYIELNDNEPYFADNEKVLEGFSNLDNLHRCGVAFAYISKKTLSNNKNKRTSIKCRPTGFPAKKDKSKNERLVFQRCHLIGHKLFKKKNDEGDNKDANLKRIFTGTRFMNNVMFYHEKKIAKYVEKTENHVLYRVSPYYEGNNKLVYGVQMEAKFIDKSGKEDANLSFNVFVYNKQPYIKFEYETGEILTDETNDLLRKMLKIEHKYVINEKNKIFHIENCASVYDLKSMKEVRKKGEDLQEKNCLCGICIPYWMKGWFYLARLEEIWEGN